MTNTLHCRHVCLMDRPAAFAASAGARANATGLSSFLQAFPGDQIVDTKQEKLFQGPFGILRNDTLESYLLKNWYTEHSAYDALYINSLSDTSQVGVCSLRSLYCLTSAVIHFAVLHICCEFEHCEPHPLLCCSCGTICS